MVRLKGQQIRKFSEHGKPRSQVFDLLHTGGHPNGSLMFFG